MSAVVRKSSPVLFRPSSPVSMIGKINLLPYDKGLVGYQFTALLVFSEPIHEPAKSIKRALSDALVHYSPLSGRIVVDAAGGEACIACTAEGVLFVAATASASTEDARFFNSTFATRTLLDDLAIYYPANKPCPATDPLLLMQVTEFSGGGFVVGVTWNHGVADGAGIGQFVKAVGDLARGLPSPSVIPVRWDDSLVIFNPPSSAVLGQIFRSLAVDPPDFAFLDITVPRSLIDRVRGEALDGRACTVFEALTAVLWQCRTRAIMPDPEAPTMLSFSVDLRRYAGAKDGYYGNCSGSQLAMAPSGKVANGHIREVVQMIQHAKDQIPATLKEVHGGRHQQQQEEVLLYNLLAVTCWRNLGLDEADFGGGKPARVLSYKQGRVGPPLNIVTRNGEDGGCNVWSRCVKKEHAQAFLRELASFTT